jgi:hypothetical protein
MKLTTELHLSPRSRDNLETLITTQLVWNFATLYETRSLITVFMSPALDPLPSQLQPVPVTLNFEGLQL